MWESKRKRDPDICEEGIPGRGSSQCKGPEVGVCLEVWGTARGLTGVTRGRDQTGLLKIEMMVVAELDQEQTCPVSGIYPGLFSDPRFGWDLFQWDEVRGKRQAMFYRCLWTTEQTSASILSETELQERFGQRVTWSGGVFRRISRPLFWRTDCRRQRQKWGDLLGFF